MIKTITFEDQQVELSGSAGWLYIYRTQFGHDILPDLMPVIESVIDIAIKVFGEIEGDTITTGTILRAINDETVDDIVDNLFRLEATTALNIFWAMAKKADKTIEGPEDYFDRFERFPIDEILPEVFRLIIESSVSSKNSKRLLEGIRTIRKLREQISIESQSQEPKEG